MSWIERIQPSVVWSGITRTISRFLLKEDGFFLLLENGGRIILSSGTEYDDRTKPTTTWTDR